MRRRAASAAAASTIASHGCEPLACRAIRNDANVEARQLPDHAREQRARAGSRRAGVHPVCRRTRTSSHARAPPDERSRPARPPLRESGHRESKPASAARRAGSIPREGQLAPLGLDPQRVHVTTESLCRAPRPSHDPLRLGLRLDERQHPLGDGLPGERLEGRGAAPVLGVFGHLPQRELAQRAQVLEPEEVRQRSVDLPSAGRPCPQRAAREVPPVTGRRGSLRPPRRGSGRETSHAAESRSARTTASLSDSRCWMLTVEMTSMPAARISSMSW